MTQEKAGVQDSIAQSNKDFKVFFNKLCYFSTILNIRIVTELLSTECEYEYSEEDIAKIRKSFEPLYEDFIQTVFECCSTISQSEWIEIVVKKCGWLLNAKTLREHILRYNEFSTGRSSELLLKRKISRA